MKCLSQRYRILHLAGTLFALRLRGISVDVALGGSEKK